jgi:hypothetical protein
MANFARLDENNVVLDVVVVSNDDIMDENGNEVEELGIKFLQGLCGKDTIWKQTSYNKNLRKNYAFIGGTYDQTLDAFIPPKPYDSWIFNEQTCYWMAPLSEPQLTSEQITADNYYIWDEELYNSTKKQNGWVLKYPQENEKETIQPQSPEAKIPPPIILPTMIPSESSLTSD